VARWKRQVIRPMPDGGYRAIRLWARSWLQTHPVLGVDVVDLQLALTELVSNAILHGCGPVDVELVADAGTLRLNVSDSSDVMPHQPPAAGMGSGGRGLMMVGKVATRWGADPRPEGGKTVWCEFGSPGPATTPAGPQASHFVVAAIDQRVGAPAIPKFSDRRVHVSMPEPVGIQHAIPPHVSTESLRRALCGTRVGGWVLFRHLPFAATANAACQRCAQLAASIPNA
jgi:Histidine kinase-like ATPase domain